MDICCSFYFLLKSVVTYLVLYVDSKEILLAHKVSDNFGQTWPTTNIQLIYSDLVLPVWVVQSLLQIFNKVE